MSHVDRDHCRAYLRDGAIPKADADISGPGVILAFILSAYLSFALVLFAYLTGFVDATLLNPVDTHVMRIRPYSPRRRSPAVHNALSKAILAMGDQQIVTGIAILAAGFQGLRMGAISVYHYQIVLYLAWMSSSVHLSALTILAAELRCNPGLMIWRVTGMIVLLVLLVVALIPTISNDWGLQYWEGMLPGRSGWGISARCFWGRLWGDGINSDSVLGFVILGVSYIWKVGALFPKAGAWYNRWFRHPIEDFTTRVLVFLAKRYHTRTTWYWLWAFRLGVAATLPLFALLSTLASFAASLWLAVLGLVFGTLQVAIPRAQNLWYTGAKEGEWGFGQLVPLILLVQPMGAVAEHLWPGKEANVREAEGHSSSEAAVEGVLARDDAELSLAVLHAPTLLHLLTTPARAPSPMNPRSSTRPLLIAYLHTTPLFALTTHLLQAATFCTAFIVYWVDAYSIGNDKVPKWALTVQVLGLCIGGILVVLVSLVSWTRLGRAESNPRDGRGEMSQVRW